MLSGRQLRALLAATGRELAWGLPAVARESGAWRARARGIPDPPLRVDAVSALATKRGHTDGAALFSILPRSREPGLLALLVAFEIVWDFLDGVNERGASAGTANGRQLHAALYEALEPQAPVDDHYRLHPWRCDGGYLRALVRACRRDAGRLPAYERVRRVVVEEATRAQVLALNHELDPARRDAALREWAARELPPARGADWFELTGAASASLTIHALLALAADPGCTAREVASVRRAYYPWISAATTMLDSYVDQAQDGANGDHSYVAHYPSPAQATLRVRALVARCLREAGALREGERHAVIAACMVAMYLSKDSARCAAQRAHTRTLAHAGGPLARLLLPVLRLWRTAYSQRSV